MTNKIPVSIVVPVRNEGDRIANFVTAHAWADEIIVVDNGSTDDTAERARSAGARVVSAPDGTIADARNFGASVAIHDWIFALDADETVDTVLPTHVAEAVAQVAVTAYKIRRRNFYLGREQKRGAWGRDWIVRLYRKPQEFTRRQVHEVVITTGAVGQLSGTINHEPYRDLSHHLAKMDQYAKWGAEELYAKGKRANAFDLVARPTWRFLKAYFINLHCLDGRFGLATSLLGAQTAWLKYAHLWAMDREQGAGDRGQGTVNGEL